MSITYAHLSIYKYLRLGENVICKTVSESDFMLLLQALDRAQDRQRIDG